MDLNKKFNKISIIGLSLAACFFIFFMIAYQGYIGEAFLYSILSVGYLFTNNFLSLLCGILCFAILFSICVVSIYSVFICPHSKKKWIFTILFLLLTTILAMCGIHGFGEYNFLKNFELAGTLFASGEWLRALSFILFPFFAFGAIMCFVFADAIPLFPQPVVADNYVVNKFTVCEKTSTLNQKIVNKTIIVYKKQKEVDLNALLYQSLLSLKVQLESEKAPQPVKQKRQINFEITESYVGQQMICNDVLCDVNIQPTIDAANLLVSQALATANCIKEVDIYVKGVPTV